MLTPRDDHLEFTFRDDIRALRNWPTAKVHDLEFDGGKGLRFLVSKLKSRSMPVIIQEHVYFAPMLVATFDPDDATLPFHCYDCADEWMSWFDDKQTEWGERFHGHWYVEYLTGFREAGNTYH